MPLPAGSILRVKVPLYLTSNKMEESDNGWMAHRSRLAGAGINCREVEIMSALKRQLSYELNNNFSASRVIYLCEAKIEKVKIIIDHI
jgi:hypothetical protein